MIRVLYQYVNKGSFRTLSFILAIVLTFAFFFNFNGFSSGLRTANPFLVLFILWGLITSWVHGIGFEVKLAFWRLLFCLIGGTLRFYRRSSFIIDKSK